METAEVDERLYFEMINTALEARENKLISNGKPAHAVYLLNKFWRALNEASVYIRVSCQGSLTAYWLTAIRNWPDPPSSSCKRRTPASRS